MRARKAGPSVALGSVAAATSFALLRDDKHREKATFGAAEAAPLQEDVNRTVEGQSLREPITSSPHRLASLIALWMPSVPLAWPQSAQPPGTQSDLLKPAQPNATNGFGALAKYEGEMVRNIEFRGITGNNPEMLRRLLAQQPGEPLDRDKLHRSLEALYATGRFASLQVEAEKAQPSGISLLFVATENYFYGDINVSGTPKKTNPKPNQLVDASRLDLGYPFSQEGVDRAAERMQKVLADNGYYKSSITYQLKPNDPTRQMAVDFHVVPGRGGARGPSHHRR